MEFWRQFRDGFFFGPPLTPERLENGIRVQYFRYARLEWQQLENAGYQVTLGLLGDELWGKQFIPDPSIPITGKFGTFYYKTDGLRLFGLPISPVLEEGPDQVQYFQRAKLIYHPDRLSQAFQQGAWGTSVSWWQLSRFNLLVPGEIEMAPVGEMVAQRQGFWSGGNLIDFSPPPPSGLKRIVVDLTLQRLRAYEGNLVVMDTGVATGYSGSPTPEGDFTVLDKIPVMRYKGTRPDGASYDLNGVPYNLLFLNRGIGYLIHGAYWHDYFGRFRYYGVSNGCVNVDPIDVAWLFDWAEVGTPVIIRYGAFEQGL